MGISRQQALDCFASDDLIGIGMEADAVRRRLHPEGVVSYTIDRRLDLSSPNLLVQVEETRDQGGTGIVLHNASNRPIVEIEAVFRTLKQHFPDLRLHCLSAPEILSIASTSSLTLAETLNRLKAAGLDSIPGEGADTLGTDRWIGVHRAAHHAGIPTTAAMSFGAGEPMEARVAFLEAIHDLQKETTGFQAFTLATHATGRDLDDTTAVEYLKTLAICRMLLDNIPHIQTNWEQQGLKVLQMGLRFGGNDVGSTLGAHTEASEEELRRIIRDAGFRPAQRDTLYHALFLN